MILFKFNFDFKIKKVVEKRKIKFIFFYYYYEKYYKFVNRGYDIFFLDNLYVE